MKHTVPVSNWHTALIETIHRAQDGDTIVVHTDAMRELGERARARICPSKNITFEVSRPLE